MVSKKVHLSVLVFFMVMSVMPMSLQASNKPDGKRSLLDGVKKRELLQLKEQPLAPLVSPAQNVALYSEIKAGSERSEDSALANQEGQELTEEDSLELWHDVLDEMGAEMLWSQMRAAMKKRLGKSKEQDLKSRLAVEESLKKGGH